MFMSNHSTTEPVPISIELLTTARSIVISCTYECKSVAHKIAAWQVSQSFGLELMARLDDYSVSILKSSHYEMKDGQIVYEICVDTTSEIKQRVILEIEDIKDGVGASTEVPVDEDSTRDLTLLNFQKEADKAEETTDELVYSRSAINNGLFPLPNPGTNN